jgi:hypothetical protein
MNTPTPPAKQEITALNKIEKYVTPGEDHELPHKIS